MPDSEDSINPLFLQLVLSLQSAAWYQMGKIVSPISGKIEKSLEEARISIDLLAMLQEKTKGNLVDEEKRILDNAVYALQMNYVDELEREKTEAPSQSSQNQSSSDSSRSGPGADNGPHGEGPRERGSAGGESDTRSEPPNV